MSRLQQRDGSQRERQELQEQQQVASKSLHQTIHMQVFDRPGPKISAGNFDGSRRNFKKYSSTTPIGIAAKIAHCNGDSADENTDVNEFQIAVIAPLRVRVGSVSRSFPLAYPSVRECR